MSSQSQPLGSLAIQAPSLSPQIVHISPEICMDLSLFKSVIREYRALDDTVNMRLNRTAAFIADQERLSTKRSKTSIEEQACSRLWQELVANWSRRKQLIHFCVGVIDDSSTKLQQGVSEDSAPSPSAVRKARAEQYSREVKRDQLHKELSIETIVKQRSMNAFKSRCKYFRPPGTDDEARKLWDAASS
ncbi:caffeine-induced death protein 2-domain-containing protein [Rhodocollybia butyracea]|uniref:Caffeine-induced death protein 2-domain-containing protein n=1 Tax=Rhodocollybia butyracea TaxID=206335 RepID=A0A9P5Q5K7_9AGAR|nr:caffeine-induced death protein 2-domain-containing protein [Rhodocollybia butyracea]